MNEKTNFYVVLGLIIAVVLLALNTKAPDVNVSSGQYDARETISVSATGTVTVEPDEAEVYVNIITEGTNAEKVQDDNADLSASVMNALKNNGVADDDMETTSYYLYPKTNWDRESGESEIYGYKLTHTVKVTTEDIDNTGKIVDAAIEAGANSVGNVNFKLSDELRDEVYLDALAEASEEAADKAESIATALTVGLGEVISVSESGATYSPYRYDMAVKSMAEEAGGAPTVISAGDIEVNAYVSIAYEIE